MADNPKPDEFIYADVPADTKQSFAATAEARVRQTTKSAIQFYLDAYFNTKGRYRNQLKRTAPFSITYVSDVSNGISDDPLRQQVLLARLWERLNAHLPAIIISDGGFDPEPSGLGGVETGFNVDAYTSALAATVMGKMTIEILTAAVDESSASDLADTLTYIFGPLTALNQAWVLRSSRPTDRWEVRLPAFGASASAVQKSNLGEGDSASVMWSSTVTLEVDFEGEVVLGIDNELNVAQQHNIFPSWTQAGSAFQADSLSSSSYQVPAQVRIGVPTPITYQALPYGARFVSDDPNICVVDEQNVIQSFGLGTCNIMLVNAPPVAPKTEILVSHPIEVTIS